MVTLGTSNLSDISHYITKRIAHYSEVKPDYVTNICHTVLYTSTYENLNYLVLEKFLKNFSIKKI